MLSTCATQNRSNPGYWDILMFNMKYTIEYITNILLLCTTEKFTICCNVWGVKGASDHAFQGIGGVPYKDDLI